VTGIHGYVAHRPAAVAAAAAARLGIPFGFSAHALDVRKATRSELVARGAAAAVVIACNDDVAATLRAAGLEPRLVAHGVDLERFAPVERPTGTADVQLLAVGRLVEKKGFDALIEAINAFSTARGTAIGSAILTSIDGIAAVDPTVAPSGVDAESAQRNGFAPDVIVVLTDGANTQGPEPATAAETAAVRGLRVFTIGFGTTTPTRMACTGQQAGGWAGGGFGGGGGRGFGGGRSPLVIDEGALRSVAETTGGAYYRAENADQLADALGDLPSHVTVVRKDVDVASWFAGAGGLLVVLALGLSLWWDRARTVPSGRS
jgi:Ca-activated chloride channel family protein